jgi:hypothetical protein
MGPSAPGSPALRLGIVHEGMSVSAITCVAEWYNTQCRLFLTISHLELVRAQPWPIMSRNRSRAWQRLRMISSEGGVYHVHVTNVA